MARSRREQREQLQHALQSRAVEQQAVEQQKSPDPSPRAFSTDPSPFTRPPVLPPESSAYRELVALAAYYRAEQRGFAPGGELEDWLDAEREVASRLAESRRR
jgi:DUF2934 family protein